MSFEIAKGAIMKKRQLMIPTLNIDSSMYADEDDTLGFAEEKTGKSWSSSADTASIHGWLDHMI